MRMIIGAVLGYPIGCLLVLLVDVRDLNGRVERLEHARLLCHPVVGSVTDRICVAP